MIHNQIRTISLLALCPLAITAALAAATDRGGPARGPVCDAGPIQILECTGPVMQIQLDGTGSTPGNGGPLQYLWTTCGDPSVSISDPTDPTPILTIDMNSACVIECHLDLKVSNHAGKSTCGTAVVVQDTTPPAIFCPPDLTLELGDPTGPANTGMATAVDLCNPSPAVTWTDDVSGIGTSGLGVILRTWMASDGCQASTCVQEIKVALTIHFNIHPDRCPNELVIEPGLDGTRVPASILGNAIDVTQVNLGTVNFSALGGFDSAVLYPVTIGYGDVGQPQPGFEFCDCMMIDPDGKTDIFMEFDTVDLINAFGLQGLPSGTEVPFVIAGDMLNNEPFTGQDCILIRLP